MTKRLRTNSPWYIIDGVYHYYKKGSRTMACGADKSVSQVQRHDPAACNRENGLVFDATRCRECVRAVFAMHAGR